MTTAPKFLYPSKHYPPLNRCAYCDSTENLSDEHIIAYGLGSNLVLHKGSCEKHRNLTSKVEAFILRKYLCPLRSYLSLPSRKPYLRPDGYNLTLRNGTHTWKKKVKLAEHPGVISFIMFDPPGKLTGRSKTQEIYNIRLIRSEIFSNPGERLAKLGADGATDHVTIKAIDLAKMLAKIAHSFAVAELGTNAFEETYVTHIIDEDAALDWNYWIGGYPIAQKSQPKELHELRLMQRGDDMSVIVHLFAPYCLQDAFEIIVGRLKANLKTSC